MISVNISESQINAIQSKLDQMPKKSPLVVKNAINATAKQARKQLATEAQKTYMVKTGRFNKSMTIDQATRGNLEATVDLLKGYGDKRLQSLSGNLFHRR